MLAKRKTLSPTFGSFVAELLRELDMGNSATSCRGVLHLHEEMVFDENDTICEHENDAAYEGIFVAARLVGESNVNISRVPSVLKEAVFSIGGYGADLLAVTDTPVEAER